MCLSSNYLKKIYRLYLEKGGVRISLIENWLAVDELLKVTEDDRWNERFYYEGLFSKERQSFLKNLFFEMMDEMKRGSYQQATEPIDVLTFLRQITTIALWKYDLDVCDELSRFAREFNRLDEESERLRLYNHAKTLGA